MRGPGRLPAAAGAAACGVLAVVSPRPAAALEPPPSALSHATATPSDLLGDGALRFRFPQLAVGTDPSLSAFGGVGPSRPYEFGTRAGFAVTARVAGHHLSYGVRQFPAGEGSRVASKFTSPHYQAAWAAPAGPWRIGAAVSWSTEGHRSREDHVREAEEHFERTERSFSTADARQVSVGIGRGEDAAVDVVLDVVHERVTYQHRLSWRSTDSRRTTLERFDLDLDDDLGYRAGGAVRVRLPVGGNRRLLVFGAYQHVAARFRAEQRYSYTRTGEAAIDSTVTREEHDPGDEWSAGARLAGRTGNGTSWGLHLHYARIRRVGGIDPSWSSWDREWLEHDQATAGVSVRRAGPWKLDLRGGVALVGTRVAEHVRSESLESDLSRRETAVAEDLESRFAWGALRRIGSVELTASVSTVLAPLDPFVVLDAVIPF